MAYQIDISPTAIADIEAIFLWIRSDSPEKAYRWVRGCYEIMLTLENFPMRCALALESQYLEIEIRQLLYKKQFRILFTVRTATEQDTGTVYIHRVRHGSQKIIETASKFFDGDDND